LKLLEDKRKFREKHREELALKKREWKKQKPDILKAAKNRYREKYPEKHAILQHVYRSRAAALPATFTPSQWKKALAYFDNSCAYCGTKLTKVHQEHFIPLSKGGGYTRDNIVPSCPKCNLRKGNRNPLDWLAKQVHGLVAYVRVMQYLEQ
jgi:5-methylcytosine-specific restriction endonuclease McrA